VFVSKLQSLGIDHPCSFPYMKRNKKQLSKNIEYRSKLNKWISIFWFC